MRGGIKSPTPLRSRSPRRTNLNQSWRKEFIEAHRIGPLGSFERHLHNLDLQQERLNELHNQRMNRLELRDE